MLSPSLETRLQFREFLTGHYLGVIDDLFSGAGLKPGEVDPQRNISGDRRYRVESYYANVDWRSAQDVAKVLRAYQGALRRATDTEREGLVAALEQDGFVVENGRILTGAPLSLGDLADKLDDPELLRRYEQRMLKSVAGEPELAIGTAKELVEAVSRLLLDEAGVSVDSAWSAERTFKEAAATLDLTVDDVPDDRAGADSIRKALRGLHQVVVGVAELRNRYGTGHGRQKRASGLTARHAELAVGASITLTRFMLNTRQERAAQRTR